MSSWAHRRRRIGPLRAGSSPCLIDEVWSASAWRCPRCGLHDHRVLVRAGERRRVGRQRVGAAAASIGAAMLAFAATAALIGAARSRPSRRPRRGRAPTSRRSPAPVRPRAGRRVAWGGGLALVDRRVLVEFATPRRSRSCDISDSWSAGPSTARRGDSAFALTAASIGAPTFAFAATAALIGAAASASRSRLTSRSSSEVSPRPSTRSLIDSPAPPTVPPTSAEPTPPTVPPTSPTVSPTSASTGACDVPSRPRRRRSTGRGRAGDSGAWTSPRARAAPRRSRPRAPQARVRPVRCWSAIVIAPWVRIGVRVGLAEDHGLVRRRRRRRSPSTRS